MGNLIMALAKVHKHIKYVVQDRAGVVKEGESVSFVVPTPIEETSLICICSSGRRLCQATSRAARCSSRVSLLSH